MVDWLLARARSSSLSRVVGWGGVRGGRGGGGKMAAKHEEEEEVGCERAVVELARCRPNNAQASSGHPPLLFYAAAPCLSPRTQDTSVVHAVPRCLGLARRPAHPISPLSHPPYTVTVFQPTPATPGPDTHTSSFPLSLALPMATSAFIPDGAQDALLALATLVFPFPLPKGKKGGAAYAKAFAATGTPAATTATMESIDKLRYSASPSPPPPPYPLGHSPWGMPRLPCTVRSLLYRYTSPAKCLAAWHNPPIHLPHPTQHTPHKRGIRRRSEQAQGEPSGRQRRRRSLCTAAAPDYPVD